MYQAPGRRDALHHLVLMVQQQQQLSSMLLEGASVKFIWDACCCTCAQERFSRQAVRGFHCIGGIGPLAHSNCLLHSYASSETFSALLACVDACIRCASCWSLAICERPRRVSSNMSDVKATNF